MIEPDQLRKLSPRDGDVLLVGPDIDDDTCRALAEALHVAVPGIRCVILHGDLQQLDESAMNAAGWYRK